MDDTPDVDSDDDDDEDEEVNGGEEKPMTPDFSFDYNPDETLFNDRDGGGSTATALGFDTPRCESLASAVGTDNSEGVIDTHVDLVIPCESQTFDFRVGVDGRVALLLPASPKEAQARPQLAHFDQQDFANRNRHAIPTRQRKRVQRPGRKQHTATTPRKRALTRRAC
ncbi:hypothetical protein DVH05_020996 [Phytophthora capsici]|nr:hypothetical protein DVH05_020996 [Phytophthora capsici]